MERVSEKQEILTELRALMREVADLTERVERWAEGAEQSNTGFVCEYCGRPDLVPSTVTIQANYGSIHDGETVTVKLCGDCVDNLLDWIERNA